MDEETVTQDADSGAFNRIFSAYVATLFGACVFVAACSLLVWSERNSLATTQTLAEGGAAVVNVQADNINPANEGKLVHLVAQLKNSEMLTDAQFGVTADAIMLRRDVEIYQWQEVRYLVSGGGATRQPATYSYTYNQIWSSERIGSATFKQPEGHLNPHAVRFGQAQEQCNRVSAGAFELSPGLRNQFANFESLPVDDAIAQKLPEDLKGKFTVKDGRYYLAADPMNPQIGDLRVGFVVVKPGPVSIIARQTGATFGPFQSKSGQTVEMLKPGSHSAVEMFSIQDTDNALVTWPLRFVLLAPMAFGLAVARFALAKLGDIHPSLANASCFGTLLFALATAVMFTLLIIGAIWLTYRPIMAAGLLAAAAVVGVILIGARRRVTMQ